MTPSGRGWASCILGPCVLQSLAPINCLATLGLCPNLCLLWLLQQPHQGDEGGAMDCDTSEVAEVSAGMIKLSCVGLHTFAANNFK